MGREKLQKTIWELVEQHTSIYGEMEWNEMCWPHFARQLDFLEFWVKPESMVKYSPRLEEWRYIAPRDNPNLEPTEYENVYRMVKIDSIDYIYAAAGRAPISVLQWYRVKNQHREWRKITVYWKWLRLYFNWLLPRLPDYVERYQWETIRADLCWDRHWEKIPAGVIDLKCQKTLPDDSCWTWKLFGNGDLTARIYDKSLDLHDWRWVHYRLYPDWYQNDTRRIEYIFKWRYAKSLLPTEWLSQCPTDWKVKPLDYQKMDEWLRAIKWVARGVIMLIDEMVVISDSEKINIYTRMQQLIDNKLHKLSKSKFKSCNQ